MSIRLQVLVPIVCVAIACALSIGLIGIFNLHSFAEDSGRNSAQSANEVAAVFMEQQALSASHASASAAENGDVVEAMEAFLSKGNRANLITTASHIARNAGVDFMTIVDKDGNVVVRTHEPANFGDNLAKQANLASALAGNRYTTVEPGSAVRLSVRSGAPIFSGEKLIGAVSSGFRFDRNDFVDNIKKMCHTEVTVFLGDERVSTTLLDETGERNVGTKAAENIARQVLGGKDYVGKTTVAGKKMFTCYSPIRDAEKNIVGMLLCGYDTAGIDARMNRMVAIMIAIVIAIAAAAVFVGAGVSARIEKRLDKLANVA
ncbi:MAG: cache domain-containing protein, partial [Chitinispirillales bacterium]|nr:cache domain-containing protein [Chitinispirillales bacterium]